MSNTVNECVIEWMKGENVATVTMPSGTRLKTKLLKLASESTLINVIQNKDGSVLAHVPVKWIKISPPRKVSEEQREAAAMRLREINERKRKEKETNE